MSIEIGPNLQHVLFPVAVILSSAVAIFIAVRATTGIRTARKAFSHLYLVHGIPVEFSFDDKQGAWYWRTGQPGRSGGGQKTLTQAQTDAFIALGGGHQPAQESDV